MRKHKLRELDEASDNKLLLLDEYEEILLKAITELEDELMEIEMLLQDAIHQAFSDFKEKVSAINSEMIKQA